MFYLRRHTFLLTGRYRIFKGEGIMMSLMVLHINLQSICETSHFINYLKYSIISCNACDH